MRVSQRFKPAVRNGLKRRLQQHPQKHSTWRSETPVLAGRNHPTQAYAVTKTLGCGQHRTYCGNKSHHLKTSSAMLHKPSLYPVTEAQNIMMHQQQQLQQQTPLRTLRRTTVTLICRFQSRQPCAAILPLGNGNRRGLYSGMVRSRHRR